MADQALAEYQDTEVLELEAIYSVRHEGVAVWDPGAGFVSERVWVVRGDPTASSAGGVQTAPYWNTGRLKLLGPYDHPTWDPRRRSASACLGWGRGSGWI